MAQNSIRHELNNLLITHDFDVAALSTKTGKPAVNNRGVPDTNEADMFSFDWVGPTGKNYGTMVILLDQNGGMTVYFGDNLGRTMDPEDKKAWYGDEETGSRGFLEQLKNFAIRTSKVRGGFSLEDLSKLKYAIAGQAALTESFYGTRKVSYSGEPTDARLMIKHTRPITEGDKRYRYVESLFIETVEGECFRLPFRKLAGGRAMLEHVRQGGKPYDMRGQHIAETVNQINVLSQFRRAHQGRVFEGAAGELVTETNQYYQQLNQNLKHMANGRGYNRYFESWKPGNITDSDMVVEDLRSMFIETRIDPRIETALPMLAKIQQEVKAMKEAEIFESWAARLVEGTWALPDTPEKMTELKTWFSEPRPLGPDAEDVTDVLYELIGDDSLFDQLEAMAAEDATMDAVPIVQAWVTRNQDQSPELAELAMSFQTAAPTEPPAPEAPPAAAPAAPAAPPVAEGSGGNWYIRVNGKILNDTKFKPVIFSSEDEARSHAMKLADKKRIPLSQMKLTKSWMDAPEQGVAEGRNKIAKGTPDDIKLQIKKLGLGPARRESTGSGGEAIFVFKNPNYYVYQGQDGAWVLVQTNTESDQQGVAEGDNPSTFESLQGIKHLAGMPIQESRIEESSEYTYEKIGQKLAQEQSHLDANSGQFRHAVYHEMIELGMTPKSANFKLNYDEDFLGDVASAFHHYVRHQSDGQTVGQVMSQVGTRGLSGRPAPLTEECNYTMENEYCPVHGLAECYGQSVYESELARIKSLSSLK